MAVFSSVYLRHTFDDGSFISRPEDLTPAHLALFAQDLDRHRFIGNAALIAPGLAIAARHVIDDYERRFRRGEAFLLGGGWDHQGQTNWVGECVSPISGTDLVVLAFRPADIQEERSYYHFFTAIRMPRVGERVMVISSLPQLEADVELSGQGMLNLMPHCRVGCVTEEYPFGRDRVRLPWACVEVDLPTEGGMSGAPVFDTQGALFGVVCSSVGGHEGQDARPTYVSLLYPALLHKCIRTWPKKEEAPLCEMQGLDLDRPIAFSRDRQGRLRGNIQFVFY